MATLREIVTEEPEVSEGKGRILNTRGGKYK